MKFGTSRELLVETSVGSVYRGECMVSMDNVNNSTGEPISLESKM